MPIRQAEEADIPALMTIRAAVRENILSDPSKVTIEDYRWFIKHAPLWLWEDNGIIKGFSAGDPRDSTIWAQFVDPSYERRGIGRALLAHTCEAMRAAGHGRLALSTEAGTRAEGFYRTAGWRKTGISADGEILFMIDLNPA